MNTKHQQFIKINNYTVESQNLNFNINNYYYHDCVCINKQISHHLKYPPGG